MSGPHISDPEPVFKLPVVPAGPAPGANATPIESKAPPRDRNVGESVGLPPRFFLYTLDQVATMINIQLDTLKASYVYFERRATYPKKLGQLSARNIAPEDQQPVWRILDRELVRWMRYKGFRYYETGRFDDVRASEE